MAKEEKGADEIEPRVEEVKASHFDKKKVLTNVRMHLKVRKRVVITQYNLVLFYAYET